MPIGQKQARNRLDRAAAGMRSARSEMAAAAKEGKAAGLPIAEIADRLGYKTRRSVYQLLEDVEPRTRRH